jgi:hypothetical protein
MLGFFYFFRYYGLTISRCSSDGRATPWWLAKPAHTAGNGCANPELRLKSESRRIRPWPYSTAWARTTDKGARQRRVNIQSSPLQYLKQGCKRRSRSSVQFRPSAQIYSFFRNRPMSVSVHSSWAISFAIFQFWLLPQ